jgi:hypothetical protein
VPVPDLDDAPVTDHHRARPPHRPARAIEQLAGVHDDDARLRRLCGNRCGGEQGSEGEGGGGGGAKHAWGSPRSQSVWKQEDRISETGWSQTGPAFSARTSSPSVPSGAEQVVPRQR